MLVHHILSVILKVILYNTKTVFIESEKEIIIYIAYII